MALKNLDDMGARERINAEPLPDTLAWLEKLANKAIAAAADATAAADAAKGHALTAKGEAQKATQAEVDKLWPALNEARGVADEALKTAADANAGSIQNSEAIKNLAKDMENFAEAIKKVQKNLTDFALAVVNGLRLYGESIVAKVSFIDWAGDGAKKKN